MKQQGLTENLPAGTKSDTVAFAFKITEDGSLAVAFRSRYVNERNFGNTEAPELHPIND
jgi:hypothetical protein